MKIKSVNIVYFSATGTTRKIVRRMGAAFEGAEVTYTNLTPPEKRLEPLGTVKEDVLVLALPVYEERMPVFVKQYLGTIQGIGQPAVVVGVYGNIGYGIILTEMQDFLSDKGFVTVAGGAFIGEHSFSHESFPIAAKRPDRDDLDRASQFGAEIVEYLKIYPNNGFDATAKLEGKLPLMARILPPNSSGFFAQVPQANSSLCTGCGACVKMCPVAAIDPLSFRTVEADCIHCFSCVRACYFKARSINFKLKPIVTNFFRKPQKDRKEPVWFFL